MKTLCESPLARGLFHKAVIMSGGGINVPPTDKEEAKPAVPMNKFFTYNPSLEQAEADTKKVMDWAGLTDLAKLRAASTEMLYTVGNLYNTVTKNDVYLMGRPIVDGYVSTKNFDDATREGTLADVPYMIGYTLNDMGSMAPGIAEFCKVRESKGGKATGTSRKRCSRHGQTSPSTATPTAPTAEHGHPARQKAPNSCSSSLTTKTLKTPKWATPSCHKELKDREKSPSSIILGGFFINIHVDYGGCESCVQRNHLVQ